MTDNRVISLCCKNNYVATADTDANINVWDLTTQTNVCVLPRYERLCTSMCFDPKNDNLLAVYSDRNVGKSVLEDPLVEHN